MGSRGIVLLLGVATLVVVLGAVAYAGVRHWRAAAEARASAQLAMMTPEPPTGMQPPSNAPDPRAPVTRAPRVDAPTSAISRPSGATRPEPRAAERLDREQEARKRALAKQQADYEAWAHREAMKQTAEDEARARSQRSGMPARTEPYQGTSRISVSPEARRRVSITMYSTEWCGYCNSARKYMQTHGIPFTERDIEEDATAEAEAHRLNPRGGVPVIQVGDAPGTTLVGFDSSRLEEAINAVASRY